MNQYLYDGTADGLLSAIAWILEEEPDPEKVMLRERMDTLFEEGFTIGTDATLAESLFFRLKQFAPDAAHTLYSFMLAEKEGMETSLLHYVSLAFKHGDQVKGYLTHPAVRDIVYIAKKAGRELHRMKGLLRFEKLRDGAYLAKMAPDYNIIHPLADYFSRRLRAQHWFIYDVKRRTAVRWNNGSLQFGTIEQFTTPAFSEDEKKVQALWQAFFKTIAIPERKNPRLQKSNMPMKYWKYLVEKQGE
ncbi:MAG: TIGR03915 family putative DNA repair protein [Chlorobiales bacterium]|nr:TIGR03915 family putative DNA repair protein [Chlorobiales bacterium]